MADDDRRLAAMLGDWAADAASRARARERWLTTQAEESATLVGSLVDLAERCTVVSLRGDGATWTGQVRGVGRDFCVLEADGAPPLVVALATIAVVAVVGPAGAGSAPGQSPGGHPRPGQSPAGHAPSGHPPAGRGTWPPATGSMGTGDREAELDLDMASAIAALAADRQRVRVYLPGGSTLSATVRSVGADIMTLVPDVGDRRRVVIALAAVRAIGPS